MKTLRMPRALRRDADAPTLRERAASLKQRAMAFRPQAPGLDSVTPALASMVAEWVATKAAIDGLAECPPDHVDPKDVFKRNVALQRQIYAFPARSTADLVAKLPCFREELDAVDTHTEVPSDELDAHAWRGVIRDLERLGSAPAPIGDAKPSSSGPIVVPAALTPSGASRDPIFAAIEAARHATRHVNDYHPGDDAPFGSPEARAAEEETQRLCGVEDEAFRAVFDLRSTTREGLFALIDYAHGRAAFAEALAAEDGALFGSIISAIRDGVSMLSGDLRDVATFDPVFAVIERERAAWNAVKAVPDEDQDGIDAAADTHMAEFNVMIGVRPTTAAGLLAQIRAMVAGELQCDSYEKIGACLTAIGNRLAALMGPASNRLPDCPAARLGIAIEAAQLEVEETDGQDDTANEAALRNLDALRDAISHTRTWSYIGALAQVCVLSGEADLVKYGTPENTRASAENVFKLCFSLAAFLRRQGNLPSGTPMQEAFLPKGLDHLAVLDREEA